MKKRIFVLVAVTVLSCSVGSPAIAGSEDAHWCATAFFGRMPYDVRQFLYYTLFRGAGEDGLCS